MGASRHLSPPSGEGFLDGRCSPPQVARVSVGTLRELREAIDAARYPKLAGEIAYLIDVAEWRAEPLP